MALEAAPSINDRMNLLICCATKEPLIEPFCLPCSHKVNAAAMRSIKECPLCQGPVFPNYPDPTLGNFVLSLLYPAASMNQYPPSFFYDEGEFAACSTWKESRPEFLCERTLELKNNVEGALIERIYFDQYPNRQFVIRIHSSNAEKTSWFGQVCLQNGIPVKIGYRSVESETKSTSQDLFNFLKKHYRFLTECDEELSRLIGTKEQVKSDDFFSCPIENTVFSNPQILIPCSHRVDALAIKKILSKKEKDCPVCHTRLSFFLNDTVFSSWIKSNSHSHVEMNKHFLKEAAAVLQECKQEEKPSYPGISAHFEPHPAHDWTVCLFGNKKFRVLKFQSITPDSFLTSFEFFQGNDDQMTLRLLYEPKNDPKWLAYLQAFHISEDSNHLISYFRTKEHVTELFDIIKKHNHIPAEFLFQIESFLYRR